MRAVGRVVIAVVGAAVLAGCASPRRTPAGGGGLGAVEPPKPLGKPMWNGERGSGSFPVKGDVGEKTSPAELAEAVLEGYRERLVLTSSERAAVRIEGLGAERLEVLAIDVSDASVRPEYVPAEFGKAPKSVWSGRSAVVAYRADPLVYADGRVSLFLDASDATLDVMKAADGQQGLVVAGAASGRFELRVKRAELERLALAGVRKGAGKAGVWVQETALTLTSDGPRSLRWDLRVKARWMLLPMTFHVFGKMDVADAGDAGLAATFSECGASSEDAGGALAAGFLDGPVRKLEAKRAPLASFRDRVTRATDFRVDVGDEIRVRMDFGRP